MKVETDGVLVVFWRCAEMVLRWYRPVGRSMCECRWQERSTSFAYCSCSQEIWMLLNPDWLLPSTAVYIYILPNVYLYNENRFTCTHHIHTFIYIIHQVLYVMNELREETDRATTMNGVILFLRSSNQLIQFIRLLSERLLALFSLLRPEVSLQLSQSQSQERISDSFRLLIVVT